MKKDRRGINPASKPSGDGCAECLASPKGWWFHLRRCAECGHIGCCDSSPSQHASKHAAATGHPIIASFEPTKLVPPQPYEHDTFTLEGQELRIIEQGYTDSSDSTSLYVPSIGLIVAGDVVYNQWRMYVGDTTPESRKNWIAALDRLAALNPKTVVAGHKKPGAPDSPSTIQDTKRYLEDFDRLQKTAKSDQELFDKMTELYPHWVANQSWLMFGFPGA